jgi:hypothetical protein
MRFDDFVAERGELSQRAAKLAKGGGGGGGFLAPINEATRAVDESRVLGERMMFLTARLPRVMSWQAELFVYEMAVTPEIRNTLANNESMTQSMRRFATSVEGWPAVIAREREALLKDVNGQTAALERVAKETRAALAEARPVAADVRRTSESAAVVASELRAAVREAGPLMDQVARLSGTAAPLAPVAPPAAQAAVAPAAVASGAARAGGSNGPAPGAGDAQVARAEIGPGKVEGGKAAEGVKTASGKAEGGKTARPFDIQEYESVVRELRGLVEATDSLLASRAWQERLSEVNNAADTSVARASREGRAMIDYGFYRGVFFAVFCAFLLFATALVYRLTVKRLFPLHPHAGGPVAGPATTSHEAVTPPEARHRSRLT